jgi:hypothetical protein
MRQRLHELAPYAAWLGLFVILAGLLLPLLTRQTGAAVPDRLGPALIVAGVLLVLAWPVLRPDEVREALGGRRARFGGNALLLVVSVIGGLMVLNYLSSLRYAITDLTSNRQFSISRQTVQILDDLSDRDEKVTLTAILPAYERTTAEDLDLLIDRYMARSGNIAYRRIDPQVDNLALLGLAQRLELGQSVPSRALVAEMADRNTIVYSGFDEQAVTEAIVKVMRADTRRVIFTTGHGEYDPSGGGDRSYFSVSQQLEKEGYTVDTINLATVTETLGVETADVLVVAGPRQPFLPAEARQVADYVAGGGSLLLLLDPALDAGLDAVTAPWDLQLHDDVVLQPNVFGVGASVVVQGDAYRFHSITRDLRSLQSVFPGTRSIGMGTPVTPSLQTTELITLDGREWGETDLDGLSRGEVRQDESDNAPPLTLAVAGEHFGSGLEDEDEAAGFGRVALFGTASLASDDILRSFPPGAVANFDLFLNAVNWLALEEELISIRPTEPDNRPIQPPSNPLGILLLTAVALPLAVLGVGGWIYWRRH